VQKELIKNKMPEENHLPEKENLFEQKKRIEERINRAERKATDDKLIGALRKLEDVTHSISDMQHSLNIVWKRTKQVEEELKEALATPSSLAHPQTYPQ